MKWMYFCGQATDIQVTRADDSIKLSVGFFTYTHIWGGAIIPRLNYIDGIKFKAKSSLTNPEELSFYLSAFVSAGRSVTWVLKKELKNNGNTEYLSWYKKRQTDMGNDKIMQLFNCLRIITIHKQGKIEFTRKVNIPPINENIPITTSVSFKVIKNGKVIKESNPEEQTAKIPDVEKKTINEPNKVEVFLDEARTYAPYKEGIELCNQYLKRLETLVGEAENMISE